MRLEIFVDHCEDGGVSLAEKVLIDNDRGERVVCAVSNYPPGTERGDREMEYLCLFRAAPDLLSACETAINIDWHGFGAPHVYEQLRAAIAKAKEVEP